MNVERNIFNQVVVFTPLAVFVFTGYKTFEIWPQITYLWSQQANPVDQLLNLTPHSFRYSLLYPVLIFSSALGVDKDLIFSMVVLLLGFLSAFLILDSLKFVSDWEKRQNTATLCICLIIVFLLFLMNGRRLAPFGFSLISNTILKLKSVNRFSFGVFAKIFLALIFSSVSSGTLMVALLTLLVFLLEQLKQVFTKLYFSPNPKTSQNSMRTRGRQYFC